MLFKVVICAFAACDYCCYGASLRGGGYEGRHLLELTAAEFDALPTTHLTPVLANHATQATVASGTSETPHLASSIPVIDAVAEDGVEQNLIRTLMQRLLNRGGQRLVSTDCQNRFRGIYLRRQNDNSAQNGRRFCAHNDQNGQAELLRRRLRNFLRIGQSNTVAEAQRTNDRGSRRKEGGLLRLRISDRLRQDPPTPETLSSTFASNGDSLQSSEDHSQWYFTTSEDTNNATTAMLTINGGALVFVPYVKESQTQIPPVATEPLHVAVYRWPGPGVELPLPEETLADYTLPSPIPF